MNEAQAGAHLLKTNDLHEAAILARYGGKEKRVLEILHGLNEVHHTIANWLCDYARDETKAFPVHDLGQQLLEIEERYHLENFLTTHPKREARSLSSQRRFVYVLSVRPKRKLTERRELMSIGKANFGRLRFVFKTP